jgi:tripartite-type tricarboxylate transporter receptor subunit TctC
MARTPRPPATRPLEIRSPATHTPATRTLGARRPATPAFATRTLLAFTLTLAAAFASVTFPGAAHAQAWPNKPVRLILSQAPGTSPDITARLIADKLGRLWGQGVVIENRAGGQNVIGAQAAAKAAPDGYTFFYATTAAIVSNPVTFKNLPYDPQKDFDPVAMVAKSPMVVAVASSVPAKNLAELVALDKAKPGTLSTAHEGPRTFSGMMSAALNHATGMKALQVPYNGAAPMIQDTIGGRTQIVLLSSAAVVPFIKRGDLRAVAVTAGKRLPGLEDVPTLSETYPGFEYVGWFAVLAPAGTPKDIVARVNRDVNTAMADADIAKKFSDAGLVIDTGSPEQLNAFLGDERTRWAKLVKEIGLQPE